MTISRKFVLFFVTAFFLFYLPGCDGFGQKKKYPDSDMYNFSRPVVIKLPSELDEISGIAYYPKDTSVFAIVDEDGMLYKIPVMNPNATKEWRFGKQRDYEDLVLVDSVFYILVSNGDIVTARFTGDSIYKEKSDFSSKSKKANEFESLYYYADSGKLVMLCKECEDDTKKTFSSYYYNFHGDKSYEPYLVMDAVPIAKQLGLDKLHIKASAAAINPVTEDLYIISAINSIIIITSKKGEFKKLYKLNPAIYKQPEGIAFTPQGDLIISNEAAETGTGELLILKNKLKGR